MFIVFIFKNANLYFISNFSLMLQNSPNFKFISKISKFIACQNSKWRALYELSFVLWLAVWVGTMNQTLHFDWPSLDYPQCPARKIVPESQLMLGQDSWKLTYSFFLCKFMDFDSVSIVPNTHKKELSQYPAILTELAWSITYHVCY